MRALVDGKPPPYAGVSNRGEHMIAKGACGSAFRNAWKPGPSLTVQLLSWFSIIIEH